MDFYFTGWSDTFYQTVFSHKWDLQGSLSLSEFQKKSIKKPWYLHTSNFYGKISTFEKIDWSITFHVDLGSKWIDWV